MRSMQSSNFSGMLPEDLSAVDLSIQPPGGAPAIGAPKRTIRPYLHASSHSATIQVLCVVETPDQGLPSLHFASLRSTYPFLTAHSRPPLSNDPVSK
jgi:hypothetical protein